MNVEDIASQITVIFETRHTYSITEKTIYEVHVYPGSAETLVKRGGITNHRSLPEITKIS